MTTLDTLKQPIAIRPELVATAPTTLIVHPHSISNSGSDFTISAVNNAGQGPSQVAAKPAKLFFVDGKAFSWSNKMCFIDASGLPLFELHRKKAGVTWFVSLPETKDKSIATIAPQGHLFKDKFDVYIRNAADGGVEVKLEVRGNDIWKYRTSVYYGGSLVMSIKIKHYYLVYVGLGKRPEWEVSVAQGFDLSLASIIGVLLVHVLYKPSYQSSFKPGESGSSQDRDANLPIK
ncbi:uncharacterized protein N7482_002604 [Penicillium canariense]|uniref:Uncharacterized protein n=1 Tax=Penicillium canariense TaxID=189055 RepID=A0A9W9II13_9EURO|nr:uncharacterized protein N7482_002604 [Penicillium canariense]KAJ5176727.1 hypothetical protein N7482_002604 [Penicillium canariense]